MIHTRGILCALNVKGGGDMPVNDFQSEGLQKAKREAAAFAHLVETSVLRGGRVPTNTTAVDRAIDQGHVAERLYKHFLTQPPPPLIQALRSLYALEKAVRHKDDAGAQAALRDVVRAVAVLKRSVKSARVRGKGIPNPVAIYRRLNADVSGIFFNARRGNILTVYKHLVGAEQWLSKLSQEAPAARAEMKKLKQLLSQIRQEVAQGADSEQLFEYARQAQRITYHMKGKMRGTGESTRSVKPATKEQGDWREVPDIVRDLKKIIAIMKGVTRGELPSKRSPDNRSWAKWQPPPFSDRLMPIFDERANYMPDEPRKWARVAINSAMMALRRVKRAIVENDDASYVEHMNSAVRHLELGVQQMNQEYFKWQRSRVR